MADNEFLRQAAEVATTDATPTTLDSFTMPDDHSHASFFILTAGYKRSDGSPCGGRIRGVARRTTTGNVSVSASNVNTLLGTAASAIALAASGNDVQLRVTGEVGETYDFCSDIRVFFE